jgi:hypothetical protein
MALSVASRLRFSTTNGSTEPDPVLGDLPKLADDPEVIRLTERMTILRRAHAARQALLHIRSIDNELRHGTTSPRGPRADMMRARRATLLASLPTPAEAHPVSDDDAGLHPSVSAAMRLVRGEKLPAPADSAAETTRLTDEMNVLAAAIRQVDGEFDQVREDRSAAVAHSLLEQYRSVLRSKFQAAMALCQASAAERAMIATMIQAGYTMQPGILLSPRLDAEVALGSPARADSPIARYRAALELAGVL